jgi:hypothetical protein
MRYLRGKRRVSAFVFAAILILFAVASVAIAQSQSAFSLNSPASFPVDI